MKIAVFSTKPYDRDALDRANKVYGHDLVYFEPRLSPATASLARGFDAICPFVNDDLSEPVIEAVASIGVRLLTLRSAGFNHVDLRAAAQRQLVVARVPAYSPHAVAEHAIGMILTLNRKFHRAYARVRDGNFSLEGLLGFDLCGKTIGVVGTGKIGTVFCRIAIAVVALRRTRVAELAEGGSRSAKAVGELRDNPEQFLATVQIGITVVGSTAGAFGGMTFARDLAPVIAKVAVLRPYAEEIALTSIIALVSYLSLVLGELVPKSLALRAAEPYALLIGRPLLLASRVARPLVWLLTASSNAVLKLFGDRTTFTETRLSPEELQRIVEEAASAGTVHPHAGEIATRALALPQLTAHDVMVPRNKVVAVAEDTSIDEVRRLVLECGHSRLPVYQGTIDRVIGYVIAKDLLARQELDATRSVREVVRPSVFVSEIKPAIDLLHEMRHRRVLFAVVVEEQGGTSGIVTMEDLVEELVGEIFNEHAAEAPPSIRYDPDGVAVVDGSLTVRDVNRQLGVHLPEDGAWSTVAGLFLAFFGSIPTRGDRVEVGALVLEVLDASPRRIRRIRIAPCEEFPE